MNNNHTTLHWLKQPIVGILGRERATSEAERAAALSELTTHAGAPLVDVRLSNAARVHLLELHARALANAGGALTSSATASAALMDGTVLELQVRATPGECALVSSPAGSLRLHDMTLELQLAAPA